MTLESSTRTGQHLKHLIVTRNEDVPNFSLLLGAGASSTSNVITATGMIDRWHKILFDRSEDGTDYPDWLRSQPWHGHEDEYSMLFEEIYDEPSQRRVYIEECLKDARPGWGYAYLTNLLSERFFDVVFTTNFDDLINEACYLYSHRLRPIVAAHDSAIQGVRVTSGRPKIIKLHGDFLYDNIKNTLAELETLETNTKKKLHQFAQEYGLVVLGYSGRDRSVMDTLELLLRDEDNYKQGVYWCIRKGERPTRRLESLLRKDRVYVVEIDGFDQFAAELHALAKLSLPKPIARPFEMAEERAKLFVNVEEDLKAHPIIGAHVRNVLEEINNQTPKLPLAVQASILTSMGKLEDAIPVWKRAYENDPTDKHIAQHYANSLADAAKYKELIEFVSDSPLSIGDEIYYLLRANHNDEVIDLATKYLAQPPDNSDVSITTARINRAIAFKRLERTDEMMEDLDAIDSEDMTNKTVKAGVAALRGEKEKMLDAIQGLFSPEDLKAFPVFEEYRQDPDFLALVALEEEDRRRHAVG